MQQPTVRAFNQSFSPFAVCSMTNHFSSERLFAVDITYYPCIAGRADKRKPGLATYLDAYALAWSAPRSGSKGMTLTELQENMVRYKWCGTTWRGERSERSGGSPGGGARVHCAFASHRPTH